jgi:TonB family protein
MSMIPLLLLMTWQMASGLTVVDPPYPSNALHGSNVVAVIDPSRKSENHVEIIHGEEPFINVVREALQQWRLPRNRSALVVVNFRDWDIDIVRFGYDEIEYSPHSERIGWASPHSLPLPAVIVDPLYPDVYAPETSSVLPGAFVLRLEIDSAGTVRDAQVLKSEVTEGIDDFQSAAIEAVSQWRFAPARDESGKAIASEAYAICVYRPLTKTH